MRSDGLQTPGAAASPPTSTSSVRLLIDAVLTCSMATLIRAAQTSACATAFEMGHEVGCYSALLLELRTMTCGSQGMGTAVRRPATRRASVDAGLDQHRHG